MNTSILYRLVLKIRIYKNNHHSSNVCLIQLKMQLGRISLSVFIQEEEHVLQEI